MDHVILTCRTLSDKLFNQNRSAAHGRCEVLMRHCVPAAGAMLLMVPVPAYVALLSYVVQTRRVGKGLVGSQPC